MVWSDSIHVMLLTHAKWRVFTNRPIPPSSSSEVMLALSFDSREAVDVMNDVAAANGGTADVNPKQDHGFMYGRALADPDALPAGDEGFNGVDCGVGHQPKLDGVRRHYNPWLLSDHFTR